MLRNQSKSLNSLIFVRDDGLLLFGNHYFEKSNSLLYTIGFLCVLGASLAGLSKRSLLGAGVSCLFFIYAVVTITRLRPAFSSSESNYIRGVLNNETDVTRLFPPREAAGRVYLHETSLTTSRPSWAIEGWFLSVSFSGGRESTVSAFVGDRFLATTGILNWSVGGLNFISFCVFMTRKIKQGFGKKVETMGPDVERIRHGCLPPEMRAMFTHRAAGTFSATAWPQTGRDVTRWTYQARTGGDEGEDL